MGEDLQDFGVHKSLICHHSPYFKAAFNSGFEETTTGIIKLPDVKVEVFELFFHWLYTQRINKPPRVDESLFESEYMREIPSLKPEREILDARSESGSPSAYMSGLVENPSIQKQEHALALINMCRVYILIRLYIFADMVQVPALKNDCIKVYYDMSTMEKECLMTYKIQNILWSETTENDLIRKFMVDLVIWDQQISFKHISENFIKGESDLALLLAMKKTIDDARAESEQLKKGKLKTKALPSLANPLDDLTKYFAKVTTEATKDEDVYPSLMLAEISDEEYEVQEILDSRMVNNSVSYKVKWAGYPQDDEFYDAAIFTGARELIEAFHRKYPRKPRPAPKKRVS